MLIPAEVWTVAKAEQGNAVLIRPVESDMAVPIFIGTSETQSILIGLGNVKTPRPLTHDLLLTILDNLGATINRIEITELKEGTFYAQLVLNTDSGEISIDSRPSDCIALAVRVKCPIYIDEEVVDEAGISIDVINQNQNPREQHVKSQLEILKEMLEKAVEEENYEEAAKLRDQIKELEEKI